MTELLSPAWWCVLQTALVASLGAAAMWLLGRRSPSAAAMAGSAAAATILAVTALIPAPMPRLALGPALQVEAAEALPAVAATRAAQGESRGAVGEDARGVDVGVLVRRMLSAVGAGGAKPQAAGGMGSWVAAIGAVGAVVGLARFAIAMRFVKRLRRTSEPINDAETITIFAEVGRRLGLRRTVELRKSGTIASAAVIGWRRPVVLLPADRAGWTPEQLRTALAHELAHVVRNDFAWRAAVSLAQAIHFFHPLVHWLTRRLALVQELAADEIAAAAAGGPAIYLRALSELAVRLNDQRGHGVTRLRVEPIVLPALSSHLIRRIVMLRSKEGSMADGRRSAWGVSAAGLIVLIGAGTMVLRGAADTVEPTPTENPSAAKMFARSLLDAPAMFRGNQGVCVVRIHELAQRPAFAPLIQLGNSMVSEQWRSAFKCDAAPTMHLEAIECFAGGVKMTWSSAIDAKGERHESHTISSEEFVLRFIDDVEWRPWIEQYLPGAEEIHDDGFTYVKLPEFQGAVRMLVAERDPRTLVFSSNVEQLRELAAGVGDADASLPTSLASVDGGLVSLALDAVALGLENRLEGAQYTTEDAAAVAAVQAIFHDVRQFSVGFDLDAASNQSVLRLSLGCSDEASAEQVRAALVTIQPFFKPYLKAAKSAPGAAGEDGKAPAGMVRTAGEDDTTRQCGAWYLALIENSAVKLEPRGDGMVDVRIESAAPFPSTVLTAYGMRDDAEAAGNERR